MTGKKFDGEKPMVALVPPKALEEEARVWTFGAKKYDKWNWHKGITYVRILSAIGRHYLALLRGEDIDPESGCHHAACIRANCGMLIQFHFEGRSELDDRMLAEEQKGIELEEMNKENEKYLQSKQDDDSIN